MAFAASAVFTATVQDAWLKDPGGTAWATATNLEADALKVALYNNSVVPDKNATAAASAYGAGGTWTTGNEVTDATNWVAGGRALAGNAITAGAGYVMFDATDLAGGGNVTISNAYGCMVYDSTVTGTTNRGICYNYFGGAQSVTGGTFTIVWNANGLFRLNT